METNDWKGRFYGALLEYIKRNGRTDAIRVTGTYDSAWDSGGCETCGPEIEYEVDIFYQDSTGVRTFTFNGRFSDLINEL